MWVMLFGLRPQSGRCAYEGSKLRFLFENQKKQEQDKDSVRMYVRSKIG
jgi:hypothetical protein